MGHLDNHNLIEGRNLEKKSGEKIQKNIFSITRQPFEWCFVDVCVDEEVIIGCDSILAHLNIRIHRNQK